MVSVAVEEVKVFITTIIIVIIIIIIIIIIFILFYHCRAVAKLIILGSKCLFLAKLGQNSKSKICMEESHPFLVIATALFFREHSRGTL